MPNRKQVKSRWAAKTVNETNTTGFISELKAKLWLIDQGYDVFENIKPVGPIDLIAFDPETEEVILIDVKTIRTTLKADGSKAYNVPKTKKVNSVKYLGFNPDENEFIWFD